MTIKDHHKPIATITRAGGHLATRRGRRWLWILTWTIVTDDGPRHVANTWTCDSKDDARAFAFTHVWAFVGASAAGLSWRDAADQLARLEVLS